MLPFRRRGNRVEYAIFRRKRKTGGDWQFIAGGAELGERATQAARREACEEAGIPLRSKLIRLDSMATIPVQNVAGFLWGPKVLVIPERCFGVAIQDTEIRLSREHTHYRWVSYEEALRRLHWDSNRNALWELNLRLRRGQA